MDEECNAGSFGLNEEETGFAVTLAHALKEENVHLFLEIYDSIPASLETKRVSEKNLLSSELYISEDKESSSFISRLPSFMNSRLPK